MPSNHQTPRSAAELRQYAEDVVAKRNAPLPANLGALAPEEIQRQFHELRVHEIELEMQNEELRAIQAELDAARERYFDLYDLAPVGYCTIAESGLIQKANLTIANLLGVPRSALVDKPISRFLLKKDQDVYYLHRKRLFGTGKPQVAELRMLRASAGPFWARLESTLAHDDVGTPTCRSIVSDISERRRSQQAVAESERKFRTLAERSPSMILISQNGRLVYANPRCEDLLGYRQTAFCAAGFGLGAIAAPESLEMLQERLRHQPQEEPFGPVGCALLARDGRRIEAMLATSRIDYEGQPAVLGILTDMTQFRKAEAELRQQREQVRSLVAVGAAEEHERRRIAAGLHDGVGQLLFAVMLKLRQIWKLAEADELMALVDEAEELVGHSIRETQTLTFELSFPVLYESGLAEALRDICKRMQSQYHLPFELADSGDDQAIPEEVGIVLLQAVRELLLNVVKHADATSAAVSLATTTAMVRISVQDDGIGFDAVGAGMGACPTGHFGLPSIRNRLERIGGRLLFDPDIVQGCRAVLEVPLEVG